MKKIKNRLKTIFGNKKEPFNSKTETLTKEEVDDIKSAITEIELRDR